MVAHRHRSTSSVAQFRAVQLQINMRMRAAADAHEGPRPMCTEAAADAHGGCDMTLSSVGGVMSTFDCYYEVMRMTLHLKYLHDTSASKTCRHHLERSVKFFTRCSTDIASVGTSNLAKILLHIGTDRVSDANNKQADVCLYLHTQDRHFVSNIL